MSKVFISAYKRFSLFSLAFVVVVVFVLRFSSNRDILNIRVMTVRGIELRTRLSKNVYLSRDL